MTPTIRDADPGVAPTPGAESKLAPAYCHQLVLYNTSEAPGSIIVDTSERFLYLIQPNNRAWHYGIGVGRDGFQWQGLGNTVYRIHGTNAPDTIGHAVSSGCFRLANDEIVDLYRAYRSGRR
jgi:lipoprotein-anchoring transpeptidase ErfK/SrfK